MDPVSSGNIVDNLIKLGPLSTNVLLMIAVVTLWRKMNNGYYVALREQSEAFKLQMRDQANAFDRKMENFEGKLEQIEQRLYEALGGKYERRVTPRTNNVKKEEK